MSPTLPGPVSITVSCGNDRHEIRWTGHSLALIGHFQGKNGKVFVPGLHTPQEAEALFTNHPSKDQFIEKVTEWSSWSSLEPQLLPECGRIAAAWGRHSTDALPPELAEVLSAIDAWLQAGGRDERFELLLADMVGLGFAEPIQREWARAAADVTPDRRGPPPRAQVTLGDGAEPRVAGELNKYRGGPIAIELPREWLRALWASGRAVDQGLVTLAPPAEGYVTTLRFSMRLTFGEPYTLQIPLSDRSQDDSAANHGTAAASLSQDVRLILNAGASALWAAAEQHDFARAASAAEQMVTLNARLRIPNVRRDLPLPESELTEALQTRFDQLDETLGDHLGEEALAELKTWEIVDMLALYRSQPESLLYAAAVGDNAASSPDTPIAGASSDARAVLAFARRCRTRRLVSIDQLAAYALLPEDRFWPALAELQALGLASHHTDVLLENAKLVDLRAMLEAHGIETRGKVKELRDRAQQHLEPHQVQDWFRLHGATADQPNKLRVGPIEEPAALAEMAEWADELATEPTDLSFAHLEFAVSHYEGTTDRAYGPGAPGGGEWLESPASAGLFRPTVDSPTSSEHLLHGDGEDWEDLEDLQAMALAGEVDEAIRGLRSIAEAGDDHAGFLAAALELGRGRRSEAAQLLERSVAGGHDRAFGALVAVLDELERFDRAESVVQEMLDSPSWVDPDAIRDYGLRLYRRGRATEARQVLAACANDGDASAAYNLGVMDFESGDHDAATSLWKKATERGQADAAHSLGLAARDRGAMGEARDWLLSAAAWGSELAAADLAGLPQPEPGELAYEADLDADVEGVGAAITDGPSRAPDLVLRGHTNALRSVSWNPRAPRVATASEDGTLRIWHLDTGDSLEIPKAHRLAATRVTWSPAGDRLASTGWDLKARIWDGSTGVEVASFNQHDEVVEDIKWNQDGIRIASASRRPAVTVWDPDDGRLLQELEAEDFAYRVAWAPDNRQLAGACWDCRVRVWDTITPEQPREFDDLDASATSVDWNADGTQIVATGGYGAIVWDSTTGERLSVLDLYEIDPDGFDGFQSAAWSPSGDLIACATEFGKVMFWNPKTGDISTSTVDHDREITALVWSPHGDRAATACHSSLIRIWDPHSGQCVQVLEAESHVVWALAWSTDGTQIAAGGQDGALAIWDIES